jgi:hypothetical protein
MFEVREHEVTCGICDTDFIVEIEYEPRYTSRMREAPLIATELGEGKRRNETVTST